MECSFDTVGQSPIKVALIIPVLNAKSWLPDFLIALQQQKLKPNSVLFIDSSSTDGTPELLHTAGYDVYSVARAEFNHGGTRGLATSLVYADIYVMLTQDALLEGCDALTKLVVAFDDDKVGAAYGRQLPHRDAGVLGAHARLFNYPPTSETRSIADASRVGVKTCFSSDSFAAYRRIALDAINGFPPCVIGSEDAHVVGRMLLAGWKVRYAADACVRHSHDYTLGEQFRRYFDIGVFYGEEKWISDRFGKAGREGLRFVHSEICFLLRSRKWYLIPYAMLQSVAKAVGYKLGKWAYRLPLVLVKRLSMNPNFWNQIYDRK